MPNNNSNFETSKKKPPIFDNVHGFIHLSDLEWEIVNSQPFQRLRNIKQLGLTHFVFPGATHTRFSHSLGVLHIASEMFDSIERRRDQSSDYPEIDKKIIRLAALLHDIGHYPLSHTIESVVMDHTNSLNIQLNEEVQVDSDIVDETIDYIRKSKSHKLNCNIHQGRMDLANHERIATLVIFKTKIYDILKRNDINDNEIRNICEIITGRRAGPENAFIHSELDADRFDYLLRDSYHTGVSYGKFDLPQIIRHLDYKSYNYTPLDPQSEEQTSSGLVIRKKGRRSVEDYLISRYFLYSTVIFQKANIGFHKMMAIVYEGLLERGEVLSYGDIVQLFDHKSKISDFCNYDDIGLETKLRLIHQNKIKLSSSNKYKIKSLLLKELIRKLLVREPLKSVKSTSELRKKTLTRDIWRMRDLHTLNRISISSHINKDWIITDESATGVTMVNPKNFLMQYSEMQNLVKEKIKVYDPDITGLNKISLLTEDDSSILKELADKELLIRNVYTKNEDYKSRLIEYCL